MIPYSSPVRRPTVASPATRPSSSSGNVPPIMNVGGRNSANSSRKRSANTSTGEPATVSYGAP